MGFLLIVEPLKQLELIIFRLNRHATLRKYQSNSKFRIPNPIIPTSIDS